MKKSVFFTVCISIAVLAQAQGIDDVNWCLEGDSSNYIVQQPMHGYCPDVLAGAAVGLWYGSQESQVVASQTQKGWSRYAARTPACGSPTEFWKAVGMLAACQCHNTEAADWILAHPSEVIETLRTWANCN